MLQGLSRVHFCVFLSQLDGIAPLRAAIDAAKDAQSRHDCNTVVALLEQTMEVRVDWF